MLSILLLADICGCLLLSATADSANSYVPKHGKAIVLFDGSHPAGFDSFLKTQGLNNDPEHVFKFEDGVIHVSGTEMGYLITKQEYADYYLRAEFKWGEATHAPREGQARDSGILYHIQGEQKVWPTSLEYQICEGQTGDFYMTDGAALTGTDGKRETGPAGGAAKSSASAKGRGKMSPATATPTAKSKSPTASGTSSRSSCKVTT